MEKKPCGVELLSQLEMLKCEIDQNQIKPCEILNWSPRIFSYMDPPEPWLDFSRAVKEGGMIKVFH